MGLISGRQTKIVWSFKSKALTKDLPKSIAESAADAVRLVYTPGSDDKLLNFLKDVREYEQGRSRISAMLDITPQARAKLIGLEEPKELRHGEQIFLSVNPEKATHLKIEAEDWQNLFTIGSKVFFGYGNVVLTVEEIKNEVTTCRVLQGGTAYPRMEIHVPSTRKPPSLNHLTDLNINEFSRVGVDYVVLPGFSESREIEFIRRRILKASDELPWIILKIDNKGVYEKLEGLLPLVDGVMISRRELALTLEPASIPMITKEVVQLCNNRAKLVLIASEILGSMRYNPTPTRAEVSDIANCVMDGADAVVLSEDICRGIYSKKALDISMQVVKDIEANENISINWVKEEPIIRNEFDAVSRQAYKTAKRLKVRAIVCLTKEGNTALRLSSFRQQKPIIALTFSEEVNRKLSLVRGVDGVCLDIDPAIEEVLPAVNDLLKRRCELQPGDKFVFVTVTLSSVGRESSNLFTVQQVY